MHFDCVRQGYPNTSWFDCEQFTYLTLRVYDTAGSAIPIGTNRADSIPFTQMSCQAVNMFTLNKTPHIRVNAI